MGAIPLALKLISYYCGKLMELSWSPFQRSNHLKVAVDMLKDEIGKNISMLKDKKSTLSIKNNSYLFENSEARAVSALLSLPRYVQLHNAIDELYVHISPSTTKIKNSVVDLH